jgi:CHAT domain-containing protein
LDRGQPEPGDVAAAAPPRKFGRAPRDDAATPFDPLPATAGELASIERNYRQIFGAAGITTLERSAASETAFRRQASQHRYLHLATHGFFAAAKYKSALARVARERDRPEQLALITSQSLSGFHPNLLSGLALAGANHPTDEDDGILTAEEVQTFDLRGTELVVLSACETGLGERAGGEGLLGLQRAFQVAGAKTVIASLWKVEDVATRDLMERFYENLWSKTKEDGKTPLYTKLEALREAQLWMLKERGPRGGTMVEDDLKAAGEKRLPPYYWAAFVLSGDWR